MAIWGLCVSALGVVCCGPLFSTVGLILCLVALFQINRDPNQAGRSLAIIGIILAIIGYALFAFILVSGILQELVDQL